MWNFKTDTQFFRFSLINFIFGYDDKTSSIIYISLAIAACVLSLSFNTRKALPAVLG